MAARIKKDDIVYIRSGDDKGKTGKVLRVYRDEDSNKEMVLVEGINIVWKHNKPSQAQPKGGRVQKLAPIHISKVQPVDPKTGRGARVKFVTANGEKHRVAAKSGSDLGLVSKV